jgi:hypothetical protein
LLTHLKLFRQGHVVAGLPFFYFGNPGASIHALSSAHNGEEPLLVEFDGEFAYGLIITQTCDIQEEGSSRPLRPWVQVCPIYRADEEVGGEPRLSKSIVGSAKKNKVGYLVPIPGLGEGEWFADLRLVLPIEKGFLQGKTPIEGLNGEEEYRRLSQRLAVMHGRPAFDQKFGQAVQAVIVNRLAAAAKDPNLYQVLQDEVLEFRVATASLMEMTSIELICLTVELPSSQVESWLAELEQGIRTACTAAEIEITQWKVTSSDEMSATEYRRSVEIPLSDASPSD